ncbi:MFS transporter [Novosphingobium sp.]|uniref:MFS transporter n=1 Tax=Novosphingobium sp. TaxID=1874826 RepID=UPI00286DD8C5|nr:MFS transporter [Novosphingobium sp.]
MHPVRQHARVLSAALAGTAVEFYDFYIYATAAALVFGPLFFPAQDPAAQLALSFLTFGIAFVARPVGAIAFGHFGDRIGRKSTLVASLMLMGGSTLLIAFLPTYAMAEGWGAGWLAPTLLCLLRFGQGFGLGGEWGGAALLAVENAPKGWEARFGAAPQFGAPVGFLAANGLFLVLGLWLPEAEFKAWGWRIPFLLSAVLVGLGLWVRLRIGETPQFRAALEQEKPPAVPLARLFAQHGWAVLAGTAGAIACFAIFYLATAFALGVGTTTLGYNRTEFLTAQLAANCFLALGIGVAAYRADKQGSRSTLALGAAATVVLGFIFGPGLQSGSLFTVFATLSAALFVMGYVYGPLGAWLPTLYPPLVRYSGVSVAFNAGGIVGGALTPFVAQGMAASGNLIFVGMLISVAGLMTLIGVLSARPTASPA